LGITLLASELANDVINGVVIAGFIVLIVTSELAASRWVGISRLNRSLSVFILPLLFLFAYIVIIWGARLVTT